ncbi:MAG: hypothetical protein AVDCRST_MAG09-1387, partial [uncultured Sphingomonas sp.]
CRPRQLRKVRSLSIATKTAPSTSRSPWSASACRQWGTTSS